MLRESFAIIPTQGYSISISKFCYDCFKFLFGAEAEIKRAFNEERNSDGIEVMNGLPDLCFDYIVQKHLLNLSQSLAISLAFLSDGLIALELNLYFENQPSHFSSSLFLTTLNTVQMNVIGSIAQW